MNKKGLGKGLSALIPTNFDVGLDRAQAKTEDDSNKVLEIKTNQIEPNKYQPRKSFNNEALEELVQSIKEHGIVQPIVLRKAGKKYEIVAGERRWRAAKKAGLKTIPAIIKEFTEQETTEIALIENIQRENLNPIEEAGAYQILLEEFKLTQEELSQRVGKSRPYIANTLRLLNAPATIQDHVISGELSAGHVRALLPLPEEGQKKLAKKIIGEKLSVRETEAIVKSIITLNNEQNSKTSKQKSNANNLDPNLLDLEDRLKSYFGTKVRFIKSGKKGKIEIEYYSEDDLIRIIDLIDVN
jgi:ParB family chromosome partitioning protein